MRASATIAVDVIGLEEPPRSTGPGCTPSIARLFVEFHDVLE